MSVEENADISELLTAPSGEKNTVREAINIEKSQNYGPFPYGGGVGGLNPIP